MIQIHQTPKGLLRGNKITKSHAAVIEAAVPIVLAAKEHEQVSKVVVSRIARVSGGPRRLKFQEVQAGLKMTVRGSNSQQVFFLHTSDRSAVQQAIEAAWRGVCS